MTARFISRLLACLSITALLACETVPGSRDAQGNSSTKRVTFKEYTVERYQRLLLSISDKANALGSEQGPDRMAVATALAEQLSAKGYSVVMPASLEQSKDQTLTQAENLSVDGIMQFSLTRFSTANNSSLLGSLGGRAEGKTVDLVSSLSIIDTNSNLPVLRIAHSDKVDLPEGGSTEGVVLATLPQMLAELENTGQTGSINRKTSTRAPNFDNAGFSRTQVRRAQSLLNRAGYSVGKPDGLAGRKTAAALSAFQKSNGLKQTAKLNKRTLAALEANYGQVEAARESKNSPKEAGVPSSSSASDADATIATDSKTEPAPTAKSSDNDNNSNNNETGKKDSYAIISQPATEVYESSSPFSKVLKELKRGSRVRIVEDDGSWLRIEHGSTNGFIYRDMTDLR